MAEKQYGERDFFVHPTAELDMPVSIGDGSKIWHFSHIMKNTFIGENCNLGQNVVAGPDVKIGNGCKIQNNVSLYKGVTLEEDVFCGPSMVFTNVFNPRAHIRRMDEAKPTLVKKGASLGANCTIVCGVTIGEYAFVGAGAVVTKDVADHALVIGNPARHTGWVCECGEKLNPEFTCPKCKKKITSDKNSFQEQINVKFEASKTEMTSNQQSLRFIDLAAQQKEIRSQIEKSLHRVLDHGKYILGPEVQLFEEKLADFVGVKHCIGVSNGTDALLMCLMAQGIGPGDAVFTTPFTFVATAEVISLLGASPVFVDIDPHTFNLDPVQLRLAIEAVKKNDATIYPIPKDNSGAPLKLTPKGIIPVDLFGLPAEYDDIMSIAKAENLFVLEDAAQGLGSDYKGRRAGSLGHMATTSFFPAKPLGCYGDGGAIFTNEDTLADIVRSIRIHGKGTDKYDNVRIGLNGRLHTIQAAVLLSKLEIFPIEIEERQRVANQYTDKLKTSNLITPTVPEGLKSVWAQYSLISDDRDAILSYLTEQNIPTAVYYKKPLHLQPAYTSLNYSLGDMPHSENISQKIFSLPMHPYLTTSNIEMIVKAILEGL